MKQNLQTTFQKNTFFFTLLLLIIISGCSPSHVLHHKKGVSRDYTYVDFIRNCDPFKLTASVGGEHIKIIKIIGFEGDKFLLEFTNQKGAVLFNIAHAGTEFKQINADSGTILVRDFDTIVSIETFAHPYADYTLKITPLKLEKQKGLNLFFWQD